MTVLSISDSVEHAFHQPEVPSLDLGHAADAAEHFFSAFQEFIDYSEWDRNTVYYLARNMIGCIDRKLAYLQDESLPKKAKYLEDLKRRNTGTEIDMTKFDEVHQQAAVLEATCYALADMSLKFKEALEAFTGQPYRPYTDVIDNRSEVNEHYNAEMSAVVDKFSKYLKTS